MISLLITINKREGNYGNNNFENWIRNDFGDKDIIMNMNLMLKWGIDSLRNNYFDVMRVKLKENTKRHKDTKIGDIFIYYEWVY